MSIITEKPDEIKAPELSANGTGLRTAAADGKPRIVATYDYTDEAGQLLYQVIRHAPKGFRQRRPDGPGRWAHSLGDVRRVLYRLPDLLSADRSRPVFITEGEKDADNLHVFGLLATTAPMGAGKWRPEYSETLRGRHIVILPDNDEPGWNHARQVADALRGVAASIKVVSLPGLPSKRDVSDWLEIAGNDKVKLLQLIQEAPPETAAAWSQGDAWEGGQTGPPPKHGAASKPAKPVPILRSLDTITPRPVDWLWRNWIPRRALTLLDGDPGLGKSTVTLDLAARNSRGWEMPPSGALCLTAAPEGVLLLSAEDDPERTIRPRLDAAGADPARVMTLEAIRGADGERPPVLPFDLELVADVITGRGISLVIVDPFMAYLDGHINAHRDQDVRRCMHALKRLAEQTGAAILLVRHLNKMNHSVALYRGGGSIGILGAVRSALIVGHDPNNPAVKVLASTKSNLGPTPRSLTYTLESAGDVARIGWGGETDLTANDVLAQPEARRRKSAGEQCAEALGELLTSGPREVAELDEELGQMGFSENAIKKARTLLKVKAHKVGFGKESKWVISPPLKLFNGGEGE